MIGQLIGSLTGLATSIIDGKTQIKLTEAEIKKKQLTGEIDWDLEAMRATENSWKDEWITLLFSIPLTLKSTPFIVNCFPSVRLASGESSDSKLTIRKTSILNGL